MNNCIITGNLGNDMSKFRQMQVAVRAPATPEGNDDRRRFEVLRIEVEGLVIHGANREPRCVLSRLQGLRLFGCGSDQHIGISLPGNGEDPVCPVSSTARSAARFRGRPSDPGLDRRSYRRPLQSASHWQARGLHRETRRCRA